MILPLSRVCPALTATSPSADTVIQLHDLCYLHQTFPQQSLEVTAVVTKERPPLALNTVASNKTAANKQFEVWDLNWNHKLCL